MRNSIVRLSVSLVMGVIVISTALLSLNVVGRTYSYRTGDIAREDIRVPNDIVYEIESESQMEKRRVSERAPLIFDGDTSVLQERLNIIDILFDNVVTVLKEIPPQGTEDRTFQFITLKSRLPKYLQYEDKVLYNLLRNPNPLELKQSIKRILIYVMDSGILDKPYKNPLEINNKNILIRTVNSPEETEEKPGRIEDLRSIDEVLNALYGTCRAQAPDLSKDDLATVYGVVRNLIKPNLVFNGDETRKRIEEAVKTSKPVTAVLKKGLTLAREGDTISPEALRKITILNTYTSTTRFNYILGVLLLQVSFLLIFGYFLFQFHSMLLPDYKTPVVIFSIVVVYIFYTFFLSRMENILNSSTIFALYLPIPAVTMIIATLFNIFIAIIIGLYLIFFSFVVSGGSLPVVILSFSSAILGVFVLMDVEKRTDFLRGGMILGIINSIVVIGVCLVEDCSFYEALKNVELSLANGIINSILVLGIFPVFENLFDITTKFNLLELSDLNAPIFKKMLIKAPGTYNHSLMVANMAESACKEIHANYLLARVGGYYHDIGKIENAGIYIENKVTDKTVKDLSPADYSKLIISHVEKGVELAIKSKLPAQVVDFIREHHGKTIMTYFYHQALEAAESSAAPEEVVKTDFRYPGPKPHSKETAIVMLADSVEAASRSLQDPTYVKLESLVKKIIYNKLNDDELEFSNLTMFDLTRIQKAFMRILNGMFHTRIEYPEKEDIEKLEQKAVQRENGN